MDRLLAIYPTSHKVEEVLKRETRPGCRFDHKVLTFPQLMDGLYRQSPGRRPVLTPIAERLAVEEAIQQGTPEGRTPFSASAGMIDHLAGLIREFKSAALEPDDLRQACGGLNKAGAARVSAIADVFSRYEALLKRRGVADRHDREREVLSGLERAEAGGQRPRLLDGVEQLLVAEIYDFTLLQFMIVASLIRLIGDACLTIQAEPHRVDSFRFPDLTWNRFVEDESIADQVLPVFVRREGRSGRLGFILQHLFSPTDAEPPPPDDTIEIVEASNRYGEIEEIARSIRRALELEPPERIEPRRIAVVARDLAPYAEYLESVFRRYRIPLNLHHGALPIASSPAARMLEVLRLPLGGYRRQGIKRLPGSSRPPIPAARHLWLLTESGYMDNATKPLDACLEDYRRRVASSLDSADDAERRAIEAKLSRLEAARRDLHEFITVFEPLEHPGSISEHVRRLAAVLRRLGLEPATAAVEAAADEQSGAFRGWEILTDLADAARLIGSEHELSLEEFADLTEQVFRQTSLEENTRQPGQAVQALSVLDARGLDFDLVFLLGLEDGGFPRYRGDDPILPDELRVALNRPLAAALQRRLGRTAPGVLRKILRTSVERNSEDRFLFFLACSMPERRLVLTYPRSDAQGNPCLPSPFVDEVLLLLGSPERFSVNRVDTEGAVVTSIDDCFDRDSFLSWAAKNSLLAGPEAGAIAEPSRLRSIERRIEIERHRERYLAMPTREDQESAESLPERLGMVDSYNGRVPASSGLRNFLIGPPGSPRPWSASRLDEIAACGFKFFAARVLNLAEVEELDFEPSALEIGGLVHDILRDLFADRPDFSDRDRALAQGRKFLVDYRPKAEAREMVRDAAFFDLKWQTIERIVEEVIELECDEHHQGRFNQAPLLEREFAFTLRGLRRRAGGESIELALRGRIDRVDLNRNKKGLIDLIRVCDYKTSRRPDEYGKMLKPENFGKISFQLPLYLMASQEELKNKLAHDAALDAAYIILRHREKLQEIPVEPNLIETDPESRAELARRAAPSIADNIIALADSAICGEFDVDPRQCDDFCPFRRLCRYDKGPGA